MENQNTRPALAGTQRGELQSGEEWRRIREEFFATGRAAQVQRTLTLTTDALVAEAYQGSVAPVCPQATAMLAIGGFGRAELFPYSNAEIAIVHEGPAAAPGLKDALSGFVRRLWEKGLRPNLRVATIAECLELNEQNIDFNINLLDRRFLAGDRHVHAGLERQLPEFVAEHGRKLGRRLSELTRARHAKYQKTPNHREPDVKEAPGGLRDLQVIARLGALYPEEPEPGGPLPEAAAHLGFLRCFLHYRAEGDYNLLDVGAQQALGEQPWKASAAPLEYYRHARKVFNRAERALDRYVKGDSSFLESVRDAESRLSNGEFTVMRGRVLLRRPSELASDPESIFRLLEFISRHGTRAAPDTEMRLEAARDALAAYCSQPRALWTRALRTILALPHCATALRMVRDLGLMTAVFPEWANLEGIAASEPDWPFTLDEHTLRALDRIDELRATTHPSRQRFAELISEIDDIAVLAFALLFHAAGRDGSSWPLASAAIAGNAAARIQMAPRDEETVEFLLEHQLDLSGAVSGRDPDDPVTARLLGAGIGTIERLKLLAVFTYAGTPADQWRLEQLRQTVSLTERALTRELETERISELPESLPAPAEFIKGFPVRYLRVRTISEIEEHTKLYELSRASGVAVELARIPGAYKLTIVARDVPFLFASFAGAISSFGLDILKAEAFSNSRGTILDTFVLADPKRTLELNPPEIERLEDLIRRIALGKTDVRRLLRNRERRDAGKSALVPQVQFDSEACETATLVEIVAEDRPGLLYSLATTISSAGYNIDIVLIDTKGRRAIDVFYVARKGRKLSAEEQAKLRDELVAAC